MLRDEHKTIIEKLDRGLDKQQLQALAARLVRGTPLTGGEMVNDLLKGRYSEMLADAAPGSTYINYGSIATALHDAKVAVAKAVDDADAAAAAAAYADLAAACAAAGDLAGAAEAAVTAAAHDAAAAAIEADPQSWGLQAYQDAEAAAFAAHLSIMSIWEVPNGS